MNLKIKEIIRCTQGKLIIGDEEKECENFSVDTRKLESIDTYLGLKGSKIDGSDFWEDAFENGVDTVIINKRELDTEKIEKYKKLNKNIIQVENTKEALKKIATEKRNLYKNLIVIGVTGSVGKTSTKDIIANVMSQKYNTLKTEGNNNNDIGLPLTILRLKDHQVAVIEMGMNHFREISELSKIAKPTISVITNIGTSHIGNLGSRENILKAKLEILDGMENKILVLNNDNDLLNKWIKQNNGEYKIYTFGIKNKSDCMAKNIIQKENNSIFDCDFKNKKIKLDVPVGGEVFILNSLCASLLGFLENLSDEQISKGISSFSLTKKRMEIIKLKENITIINDAYNASFESVKASIEYLCNINSSRKIAVLGDMFELGNFSEELHRKVGKEIINNKINKIFLIGENVKYILDELKKFGYSERNIYYFNNKINLIEKLKIEIKGGDTILFKASNGMKLYEIAEEIKNYFDKKGE